MILGMISPNDMDQRNIALKCLTAVVLALVI